MSPDIFVHDRQTGQTTVSRWPPMAPRETEVRATHLFLADGRFVAFRSYASNLVLATPMVKVTFLYTTGRPGKPRASLWPLMASQANESSFAEYQHQPTLSADGRFVAFESVASNLVVGDTNGYEDVFVHDMQTGQTTLISVGLSANTSSRRPLRQAFNISCG